MPKKLFRSLRDPATVAQLVEKLGEGLYITNSDGEILDANPAFLTMFGVESLEALRAYTADQLYVDPTVRRQELSLLQRRGSVREFEIEVRRPDGEIRTLLDTCYAVTDPDSGEVLYHGILIDITDRKKLEARLRRLSRRDPLTGCFNRRCLLELEETLESAGGWMALVVDVDHFKRYNDEHGHKAGDEVLVRVARFLLDCTRASDAVVRTGGDEFVVLLAGGGGTELEAVAQRIERRAAAECPVPISLAWARRTGGERLEETIVRADRRLIRQRRARRRGVESGRT